MMMVVVTMFVMMVMMFVLAIFIMMMVVMFMITFVMMVVIVLVLATSVMVVLVELFQFVVFSFHIFTFLEFFRKQKYVASGATWLQCLLHDVFLLSVVANNIHVKNLHLHYGIRPMCRTNAIFCI